MTSENNYLNSFKTGLSDGVPIALGYLSVSFTFGIMASAGKLPVVIAVLISMTNLTSAGQFAGLNLILGGGSLVEMALTQLVINLRYALMSISLSQKMHKSVTLPDRFLIAFGNTDEIFAVASAKSGEVGKKYMLGLILLPFFGWSGGTLLGAAAGNILPESLTSALGIAIYGMFLAIFIPAMRRSRDYGGCARIGRTVVRFCVLAGVKERFFRLCHYPLRTCVLYRRRAHRAGRSNGRAGGVGCEGR